jgi:phosphatidylglycerophosphatase A
MLGDPRHLLSLGFGSGLSPWAPGTAGTLIAIPMYWFASNLAISGYLTIVVLATLVGFFLCGYTALVLGVHDHPAIVWDEVVGYFITMIAAPPGWVWIVWGFVLFRLFDILKPWPIGWLDRRLKGGVGIMLDDVLAGAFALICLQLTVFVL